MTVLNNYNLEEIKTSNCTVFKYLVLAIGVVLANKTGGFKQKTNESKIGYSAKSNRSLF